MTDIDNIRTWDIEKIWNFISAESDIKQSIYDKLRYGIVLKIDIYDYINGSFTVKGKSGVAICKGKTFRLQDMYTEIEERRRLGIQWIEENYPDLDLTRPR